MHSLHAIFLQFFVFHDISNPAYLPKSWISPKITNTVLVPGQGLDPREVHDLRCPNQALGRVPLHPHPPVKADPLHTVALPREPGAHRVQRGGEACGGENRQGRV